MNRFILGVDAGGTRTRAVVIQEDSGEILGMGESGSGTMEADQVRRAVGSIVQACEVAAEEAGVSLPADGLGVGAAGVGRLQSRRTLQAALGDENLASVVRVYPDSEVALFDAFGEEPGMVLIAGTGSVAVGRGEGSDPVLVGGWGCVLGDEGSGFWVGREALWAVARAEDGRGRSTALSEELRKFAGKEPMRDFLLRVGRGPKSEIASIALLVAKVADAGDDTARTILAEGRDHLMELIDTLRDRVALPQGRVALVGGLVEEGGPLSDHVVERLREWGMEPVRDVVPARGAARMVCEELDKN